MSEKNDMSLVPGTELVDLNKKRVETQAFQVANQWDQMQEQKKSLEALKSLDLSKPNIEYIQNLAKESKEYLLKARDSKVFLNNSFKGVVPFFPRNIILAAAETGSGKSTLSANITKEALMQGQKVLVLSNEENPGDVYNRITCLLKGWPYTDHSKFSDSQLQYFLENIVRLSERLTVVGDDYGGIPNCTTSIEGIEAVLNSVILKNAQYDVIILDYYQNVDKSLKNEKLDAYQVQYRLCKFLDQYKNRSNATILVLAQKKPGGEKEIPFKEAIEGRKTILNIATCAMDVKKDVENFRTSFEIKKSRFNDCIGQTIMVGFDKGNYVEFTPEFRAKANDLRAAKEHAKVLGAIKVTGIG